MDNVKKTLENKTFNNHNVDFKDDNSTDINNKDEHKYQSQVLNPKDNGVLLKDINHIINVSVNLAVQLGQAKIKIKDLLAISTGSVLILDKLIGEPLDVFVNESLIAKGEIVVVGNKYGIRITWIVDSQKI
ncbi:MAG TPA: flagellar motor switch protein FliN [Buchnera sp. (in: enterobacteria)]|nr:flagellar motor switch protein FliN [Buchnera sp. (in: enterobacteria)]